MSFRLAEMTNILLWRLIILDFSRLSAIANHFPFKMDVNQAEVRLSRSQKGYRYIHLFLSVHEYLNHIRLQIYGKGPREHKFLFTQFHKE